LKLAYALSSKNVRAIEEQVGYLRILFIFGLRNILLPDDEKALA
jgi:hypothetical protein